MKTILDSAYTFYLEGIFYKQNEGLELTLIEAFEQQQVSLQVTEGLTIKAHPIQPTRHSRRFKVTFERPVIWQVLDESWYSFDENEMRDSAGVLQVIQNSVYHEYVYKQHGWYEHSLGPAKHFRVGTENEIIDVISCDDPIIEELLSCAMAIPNSINPENPDTTK